LSPLPIDEQPNARDYSRVDKNIMVFGKQGNGPLEFRSPMGICLARLTNKLDGEILICDTDNLRIQILNRQTREVTDCILTQDQHPYSIAVIDSPSQRGKRMFISTIEGNILGFDFQLTTFLPSYNDRNFMKPDENGRCLTNLAISPGGNIIMSHYVMNCVTVRRGETNPAAFSDDPASAFDVLCVIGIPSPKSHLFDRPEGVAVNSLGQIFVCDKNHHCVRSFDSFRRSIGKTQALRVPIAVAVDFENNILVLDQVNKNVKVFSNDGNFVADFGAGKLPGEVIPTGIAVDDKAGMVYVVDSGNHRVLVFSVRIQKRFNWQLGEERW